MTEGIGRYFKMGHDEAFDGLVEVLSHDAIRNYLGRYGDAVEARVSTALVQATRLLSSGEPGPALTTAVSAIELMIRFLVLRPLLQGAFLSDEWASILSTRIATGRTSSDRDVLPRALQTFGIDVNVIRTATGKLLWETLKTHVWPNRDGFVHRYDDVNSTTAEAAIECARSFHNDVVGVIADTVGFTRGVTGRWAVIRGRQGSGRTFEAASPFGESTR